MYLSDAGCQVWGCELNPVMHSVAVSTLAANGYGAATGRVRTLCKPSGDVVVPRDMPRRADLLVSEVGGRAWALLCPGWLVFECVHV